MPPLTIEPSELQARLAALATAWRPGASVSDVQPLEGGMSSLTYAANLNDGAAVTRCVIKAAPPGLTPTRNRDVLRQAKLFRALKGAPGVRVPEVFFSDEGAPPEIPPLFVMSFAPGESFEPVSKAPDELRPPEVVKARVEAAAEMLAALHSVDPAAIGYADEPVIGLEAEVQRWVRALETVEPEFHPQSDELRDLLLGSIPQALPPAILHGDFRLGNIQCDGTELTAIIDWEIWSLSDPRIDVAWFVMFTHPDFWTGANGIAPGMPNHMELLRIYEKRRGMEMPEMQWFHALIRFKQAAASVLLDKRRREPGQGAEPGGGKPGALIRHGLQLIKG